MLGSNSSSDGAVLDCGVDDTGAGVVVVVGLAVSDCDVMAAERGARLASAACRSWTSSLLLIGTAPAAMRSAAMHGTMEVSSLLV